jgi:hypothetical protein
MTRGSVITAIATAAVALAGCGGTAGDLMSITISGGPTGKHTLVVSGDGRGSCDRGELKALESQRVIDAREIERDARKLARGAAAYPERPGARRYAMSTNDGVVRWSEGTPGLPKALPRAQLLALQLERQLCRR